MCAATSCCDGCPPPADLHPRDGSGQLSGAHAVWQHCLCTRCACQPGNDPSKCPTGSRPLAPGCVGGGQACHLGQAVLAGLLTSWAGSRCAVLWHSSAPIHGAPHQRLECMQSQLQLRQAGLLLRQQRRQIAAVALDVACGGGRFSVGGAWRWLAEHCSAVQAPPPHAPRCSSMGCRSRPAHRHHCCRLGWPAGSSLRAQRPCTPRCAACRQLGGGQHWGAASICQEGSVNSNAGQGSPPH